jgi:hypothetical protein
VASCKIAGCDKYAGTICNDTDEVIAWICEMHRRVCSCYACGKYKATSKRDGSLDTDYKKAILCPYCGEECNDEYESGYIGQALSGDSSFEVSCDSCDKEFDVEPHIDVKYSTTKKENEDA